MPESYQAGDTPVPGIRLNQALAAAHPGAHWLASLPNGHPISLRVVPLDAERRSRLENALETSPELDHPNLARSLGAWVCDGEGAICNFPLQATAGVGPGSTLTMAPEAPDLAVCTQWLVATERGDRDALARLDECQKQGQFGIAPDELLAYVTDVAAALDALHRQLGRPHGRLRASEIWLTGRVARLAGWELSLALPTPEGAVGGPAAIDQYALALTYARLRTGIPCESAAAEHVGRPPALLVGALASLPSAERQVLERSLASNPETRFDSVLELAKALKGACGGDTVRSSGSKTFVVDKRGSTAPSTTLAELAAELTPTELPATGSAAPTTRKAAPTTVVAPLDKATVFASPIARLSADSAPPAAPSESPSPGEPVPAAELPTPAAPRAAPPQRAPQTVRVPRGLAAPATVIQALESPGRSSMNEKESGQPEPQSTPPQPPADPAPEGSAEKPRRAPPTVRITPDTIRSQIDPHSATILQPPGGAGDEANAESPTMLAPAGAPQGETRAEATLSGLDLTPPDRGSELGDYVLLGKLGGGSMGSVYKAMHRYMQRLVALKVMNEFMLSDPEALQRFLREAETAARLSHPNIVACYNAGSHGSEHYLAMEFVAGRDLFHVVDREGPLPVRVALDYILQAARGLEYAHQQGIVHRDIKPGNLMLDAEKTVKILDMGLARLREPSGDKPAMLTRTGTMMGTIDYMPPEQAKNSKMADERADIYSLGCTFHYLVTGRPPFPARSLVDSIVAHRENPAPHLAGSVPGVSQRVQAWFEKTLAKQPEDRFQNMRQVIAAIEECLLHDALDASAGTIIVPALPVEPAASQQPKTILAAHSATVLQNPDARPVEPRESEQPKTIIAPRADSPTVISRPAEPQAQPEEPSSDAQAAALMTAVADRLAAMPAETGLSKQAWKILAIASAVVALALFVMRVLGV